MYTRRISQEREVPTSYYCSQQSSTGLFTALPSLRVRSGTHWHSVLSDHFGSTSARFIFSCYYCSAVFYWPLHCPALAACTHRDSLELCLARLWLDKQTARLIFFPATTAF